MVELAQMLILASQQDSTYNSLYAQKVKQFILTLQHSKSTDLTQKDLNNIDLNHPGYHQGLDQLMSFYPLFPSSQALDVGCFLGGTGRYLAQTYQIFVTGLEILGSHVQVGNQICQMTNLSEKVQLIQADICQYPLNENFYDLVYTICTFLYINSHQAYSNMANALKPGGLLYFQDYYFLFPQSELYESEREFCNLRKMTGVKTKEEIRRIFQQNGLEILSEEDCTQKWSIVAWERASYLAKSAKQGAYCHQRLFKQLTEVSCNLLKDLPYESLQEVKERFPYVEEIFYIQSILKNQREYIRVQKIVARKRISSNQ